MINIFIVLGILLLHFIGDFLFQTDESRQNKSKDNGALFEHIFTYTTLFWFAAVIYMMNTGNAKMLLFAPITFVCHFCTDYVTSRITKKLHEKGDIRGLFDTVAFDQYLHAAQLLLTFLILK